MEKIYKEVNGLQYSLLTWGNPLQSNGKDVVVCITGNPGICEFYTEFASELHSLTTLPICVINLFGHEEVKDNINVKKDIEYKFDLKGQLHQKIHFIKCHLSKNSKIHLIGHSIGAWMIVEILDKNLDILERVSSVNLLFPTIQRMAETKNGWFLNNIVRKIYLLLIFLCTILQLLPAEFTYFIIGLYLRIKSMPSYLGERVYTMLKPKVLENVLLLAFNEMDTVLKLNVNGLEKIKHLTNVIYSDCDDWAPVTYMDDLKIFQPELQMSKVNIDHAFVVKSSETVAEMVAKFISEKT